MKLAICNEVLLPMPLAEQCAFAAAAGYDGLEIAPFTLGEDPTRLSDREIAAAAAVVRDHGLEVTSLHWLLVAPQGLSITATDSPTIARTRDALLAIADLAAALGARTLVHGSPAQRRLDDDPVRQRAIALEHLAAAGDRADELGLVWCLEAVNATECNFCNRVEQADVIITEIDSPGLGLMIDVCHAAREESLSLPALAQHYLEQGRLAHVQLNAANRKGPGQGDDPHGRDAILPFLDALKRGGYAGTLAVEPFVYAPDGPACAARAAGYVRACLERV